MIGHLEGRHVRVTLADGSRLEDCELISAGHCGVDSIWLWADGADVFVPLVEVSDMQEVVAPRTP